MSWVNFTMDLATIPSTEPISKDKSEDIEVISPENEAAELRRTLGL